MQSFNQNSVDEKRAYRTYLISMCLIIALVLSGVFLGMAIKTRDLIRDELVSYGRAYFETVIATRMWNAQYGGVYVFKRPGVESNPYIENPDVETADGRTLTLRNPAMMTREISEFIGEDRDFAFRITSMKLINPENAPDLFETEALALLEEGAPEVHRVVERRGKKYFRYMGALHIKETCLQCHAHQGYKLGDVRGGISVTFNIDHVYRKITRNTVMIAALTALTCGILITLFWVLSRRLISKLAEARLWIQQMATTDELTGVFNRRSLFEHLEGEFDRARRLGHGMSCILLDIDHFKRVNDTHGHLVGDAVLQEVAVRIRRSIRKYDVLGRYGGEEFMIVMPETGLDEARALAGRIAASIKDGLIMDNAITVSMGLVTLGTADASGEDLIKRADHNLYCAKDAGRDCVICEKAP